MFRQTDPSDTAQARYFIERFNQIAQTPFDGSSKWGEAEKIPDVFKGIAEIQDLLEKRLKANGGGPFWSGQHPGLADLGVLPFIGRMKIYSKKENGFEPLASSDFQAKLFGESGEFSAFAKYANALLARPSWSKTCDEKK